MITSPVRCWFLNPLTSFVLAVFLGMIVVALVLPQVDLPDVTTYQSSNCLSASAGPCHLPEKDGAGAARVCVREAAAPGVRFGESLGLTEDLPIKHRSFRC